MKTITYKGATYVEAGDPSKLPATKDGKKTSIYIGDVRMCLLGKKGTWGDKVKGKHFWDKKDGKTIEPGSWPTSPDYIVATCPSHKK